MKIVRILIWIAIIGAFVRGLSVFDMRPSNYPVASALCFVGAVFAAIRMYSMETGKSES